MAIMKLYRIVRTSMFLLGSICFSVVVFPGVGSAHHAEGTGAPSQQGAGKAPGAKIAGPLREGPKGLAEGILSRRRFPDHPSPAQDGAIHGGGACNKNIDATSVIFDVVQVGAQDNHVCTTADIDTFIGAGNGRHYVIQGGGQEAAFIITDVEDPTAPVINGPWYWGVNGTYSPDVKAFDYDNGGTVGIGNYAVVALERTLFSGACGIVIIDVTDGAYGGNIKQFRGADWCDVHNVFVDKDANGLGTQIYVTADNTDDMRVIDIGGAYGGTLSAPVEIGAYKAATAGGSNNYVHDITVVDHGVGKGKRAYLAYWDTGLVILDVDDPRAPLELVGPSSPAQIDPAGFLNHHSFPTPDGNLVFIQDEFLDQSGDEPVQLWDISNLSAPVYVDGIALGADVPVNPAHNLEIRDDVAPGRLYVGWYKLGLQAFDYTGAGFTRSGGGPDGVYHQAQTENADAAYDGAWGVRLALNGGNLVIYQSDRRYGLVIDCEGDGTGTASCPSTSVNTAPVAVVTYSPAVPVVGDTVSLDCSDSYDDDPGDSIQSHTWSLTKKPKRSNATLTIAGDQASFVADRQGEYRVQCTVSDGEAADSAEAVINVAKSGGGGEGGGGKNCAVNDPRPKCNR